jgi:hypothetical protein
MSSSTPEIPSPQATPRQQLSQAILDLADDEVSLAFVLAGVLYDLDLRQLQVTYDRLADWVEKRNRARAAREERFGGLNPDPKRDRL